MLFCSLVSPLVAPSIHPSINPSAIFYLANVLYKSISIVTLASFKPGLGYREAPGSLWGLPHRGCFPLALQPTDQSLDILQLIDRFFHGCFGGPRPMATP